MALQSATRRQRRALRRGNGNTEIAEPISSARRENVGAPLPLGVVSMRLIQLSPADAEPISLFAATGASSRLLADGDGEAHVHWLQFEPGGQIGQHPTGFGQLFIVVEGSGWVAGGDGRRVELRAGEAAYFERGERHSKGSDRGMKVIMVQIADLKLSASTAAERS